MGSKKDISKYFTNFPDVFYSQIGHSKMYEWRSPKEAG